MTLSCSQQSSSVLWFSSHFKCLIWEKSVPVRWLEPPIKAKCSCWLCKWVASREKNIANEAKTIYYWAVMWNTAIQSEPHHQKDRESFEILCFSVLKTRMQKQSWKTVFSGTSLRTQTEGPCYILCPILPSSLHNAQTNYGRVYKFRTLVKQHQPFSSFMALRVNRKRSLVHLGPLFFSKEILSSAVLQVCTALQGTETS